MSYEKEGRAKEAKQLMLTLALLLSSPSQPYCPFHLPFFLKLCVEGVLNSNICKPEGVQRYLKHLRAFKNHLNSFKCTKMH